MGLGTSLSVKISIRLIISLSIELKITPGVHYISDSFFKQTLFSGQNWSCILWYKLWKDWVCMT